MGEIIRTLPFENSYGLRFRGVGIGATVTAGTTGDIDYKLTEDRYLNGCQPILKNHTATDTIKFQVVDVDNILGAGAGTVLDEFATDWRVAGDDENQGVFKIEYPAKVSNGLYIRVKYTSTGGTDVSVKCNLFLHKIPV